MRDYAEQIERLRECASNNHEVHSKCGAYLSGVCAKTRDIRMRDAADAIEELLAAVPKRGEWLITDAYPHRVYCSVCYKTYLPNADWELWSDGRIPRNFCPHCGARMTEVSEDA